MSHAFLEEFPTGPLSEYEQKSDSWWTIPWGNHESLQEKRQKAVSRFRYVGQTGFYS